MCGIRPATSDRCPLVGPTPLAGLLLATGTYRNGILMAPAVAALITSCVTGSRAPLDNPYLPKRPPPAETTSGSSHRRCEANGIDVHRATRRVAI
jgi:glycine/D-amino acid oxidase-like deaminating enzyme